ncbi:MAG: ATP phosphoribosyltransferase regulatory subunit [Thiotrichales bacterium]|nr:ATP phosphoribosyltransferase regulatory subunit [Thiotrichales bacterium]
MTRSQQGNRWLLPEGIEEILPPQAGTLDQLSRRIIDLFVSWGYQLVTPPLIEYLDSLLTGTGEDLELQTFKITDLMTGRMMGIRADTTPQVARIDAHNLKRETPTRLCYAGTVLHTRPASGGGTRSPLQIGAELYGHSGIESDSEILCLMLEALHTAGVRDMHVDLAHVGVFRGLVQQAELERDAQVELFDILQRKATPELQQFIETHSVSAVLADALLALIELNGGDEVVDQACNKLSGFGAGVTGPVEQLAQLADRVRKSFPEAPLYFDLAELRGYHYHSGVMFAAYVPGYGDGIAFGGRYDDIGASFGRARPATGFSMDLKSLMTITNHEPLQVRGIFAPCSEDPALHEKIRELRAAGEIVITQLPGQTGNAADMDCDRQLVQEDSKWVVK